MHRSGAVEVVHSWHRAVNARDVDGAVALCDPDVEVGGPRGTARGHDVMRRWLERSGISLEPREEMIDAGGRVVVHELARWRTPDAPAEVPTEEPAETWVVFEVAGGRLVSVRRYASAADVP